ncbi:FAD:protein FMN transferase [Microbacterium sp. A84]|uniref:FAD:protein FMN transferase n=1 Tax=Microbacterium sp. A84 TaxID=3450715 RepID=UPI003F41D2E7
MSVWSFDAIGTRWEIETENPLPKAQRTKIDALIDDFDLTWSRFREDSLVTRLSEAGGIAAVTTDAAAMLDVYRELSEATDGAVNPLVGESLNALGYDAGYSLAAGAPRAAPSDWQSILTWTPSELSLASAGVIDVGALGKGRLVDLVIDALSEIEGDLIVDAGGDLAVRGAEVRIGLEHPFDVTKAIGIATIRDRALSASAINRRAWGDGLHHVLDARTGLPVRTWAATWVTATNAMRADAAATALFFAGGAELADRWGVEWVRMSTDGHAERSVNAPVELFTASAGHR